MITDTGLRTALDLEKLLKKNNTVAKVLIYQVLQTSLLELEQRWADGKFKTCGEIWGGGRVGLA